MHQYDVIIIGAGPSGAIASKMCVEKGISTPFGEESPGLNSVVVQHQ